MWEIRFRDKVVAKQIGRCMHNVSLQAPYELFGFDFGKVNLEDFFYWLVLDLGLSQDTTEDDITARAKESIFRIKTESGYTVNFLY